MLHNKKLNTSLNKIFTYWETQPGQTKPGYIELCQESLKKNCGKNFEIHTYSNYVTPLPLFSINHKTDWLKANLIYNNGGFWIDADMVVVKDLAPLISLVEEHGFAGIPGFFGAKRHNKLLGDWIEEMSKIVHRGDGNEFSDLIQPLLTHKDFKEFGVFTKEMICPIYHTGEEFWKLFDNIKTDKILTPNTFIVTLYNSAFSAEFKKMSAQQVLDVNNWLVSDIFRKVLNK